MKLKIWSRGFYMFETRDEISDGKIENLEVFEFGAFQKNMHMASHEKYILHMIFGAFHITPHICPNSRTYVLLFLMGLFK